MKIHKGINITNKNPKQITKEILGLVFNYFEDEQENLQKPRKIPSYIIIKDHDPTKEEMRLMHHIKKLQKKNPTHQEKRVRKDLSQLLKKSNPKYYAQVFSSKKSTPNPNSHRKK